MICVTGKIPVALKKSGHGEGVKNHVLSEKSKTNILVFLEK